MASSSTFFILLLVGVALAAVRVRRETEQEGPLAPAPGAGGAVIVDVGKDDDDTDSNDVNRDIDVDDIDRDGFFVNFNPFDGMRSLMDRFRRFEELMRNMQNRLFNVSSELPTTYDNSTEEIVEIGGRRYKLVRKVTHRGDNQSSIFVSATSFQPADRKKRSLLTKLD